MAADAVILVSRPHREADRLLTLFGPTLGRRDALARGARKGASKLAASLEPYATVRVELVPGRTWPTIIHADVVAARRRLRQRLGGLAQAGFVSAVAEALVRTDDRNPALAALVTRELARIDRTAGDVLSARDALAIALFTVRALAAAGWCPDLARCARCHRPLGSGPAAFSAHPFGLLHLGEAGRAPVRLSSATRRYVAARLSRPTQPQVVSRLVAREVGSFSASALTAVLEQPLPAARFLRALALPARPLVR